MAYKVSQKLIERPMQLEMSLAMLFESQAATSIKQADAISRHPLPLLVGHLPGPPVRSLLLDDHFVLPRRHHVRMMVGGCGRVFRGVNQADTFSRHTQEVLLPGLGFNFKQLTGILDGDAAFGMEPVIVARYFAKSQRAKRNSFGGFRDHWFPLFG
jgi:hypothetical protein